MKNTNLIVNEITSYISGSGGTKRYFEAVHSEQEKVKFSLREWASETPRTIEEVNEAYQMSKIPSYVDINHDFYSPLAINQLTIFKLSSELTPNSMSLWEYETLLKGNTSAPAALKCAFIQSNDDSDEVSVICESYDEDSMTTNENLQIVSSHWRAIKKEILELLNKQSEYIECYR